MNRLDCAAQASAITFAAIIFLCLGGPASAHGRGHHVPVPTPRPSLQPSETDATAAPAVLLPDPILSIISEDDAAANDGATPTILRPTRHIYCVEFARLRSGIAIFGDAKTWWTKAKSAYAEGSAPRTGAVMVFAGTKGMRLGHVAVVTRLVSEREIRIDHANWGRDGQIYLNAPVIDVSADNDWSRVRVWNTRAGTMGSRSYPVKGFVSFRGAAALPLLDVAFN